MEFRQTVNNAFKTIMDEIYYLEEKLELKENIIGTLITNIRVGNCSVSDLDDWLVSIGEIEPKEQINDR